MKGSVEMKCSTLGVETICRLEGVSIADKACLFHCLKRALEVDALEWHLINDFIEYLEQVDDEKREMEELLKELFGDIS